MSDVLFIESGSTLLDCALGGGWGLGKVGCIYGKPSTGKTQQEIELCANFRRAYPSGKIFYLDAEAAFDESYAEKLGCPVDSIIFIEGVTTVEGFFEALKEAVESLPEGCPGLFILDSLDSLTTEEELNTKITEGTYGTSKSKNMSKIFRMSVSLLKQTQMHLSIVAQVRDVIGKMGHGPSTDVSGGWALKFYASQKVKLEKIGSVKKSITLKNEGDSQGDEEDEDDSASIKSKFKKQNAKAKATKAASEERVVGVDIKATVDKNKVGEPFRECEFTIMFGYGIDDIKSCLDYLSKRNRMSSLKCVAGLSQIPAIIKRIEALNDDEFGIACTEIRNATRKTWQEIEEKAVVQRRSKY